ncbi:MAG: hypothetical protein FWH34_08310, partial [Desulfovibrionaceae bacterium]|nr:hypothetical protein [Desulfovibrionaceae bacterium]
MGPIFGQSPKDFLDTRLAGFLEMTPREFASLRDVDALWAGREFAQHMADMGVRPGMSRTQKRRLLQPEFAHAWGRVNPESFIGTYGMSVYNEMRRQFGPGFFAKRGQGFGMDVLAADFRYEERGGYDASAFGHEESGFAETVMAPHDQFEADLRQSGGWFQLDGNGNAVSPGENNPKIAQVVQVEPKGLPVDWKNTRALAEWLLKQFQGVEFAIVDDGTIQKFTRSGLEAGAKKRGEQQRQTYTELKALLENAVFSHFEEADAQHKGKVAGQNIYYAAAKMGEGHFSIRFKVDMPIRKDAKAAYKDHKVAEIQIAPSLYGSPSENIAAQAKSAIRGISLSVLKRDVKPSRIEGGVLYQYAGERSAMSEPVRAGLEEAMRLAESGTDNEAVRRQTGWFKGMDGKWRYEIPDSLDKITIPENPVRTMLGEIYDNPELYAAYPDLKNLVVEVTATGDSAYLIGSDMIYLSKAGENRTVKQFLLHEIQHAVQTREGFARGATANDPNYTMSAGEIEAYDVAGRGGLSADQRLRYAPDINADAIVLFGGEQVAAFSMPQKKKSAPRGGIRRLDDGRYIVGLFKNRDASTVLHETGHFFLENLREAAGLETAPQWVKDSWAALQREYGFDSGVRGEAWTRAHERFAREFEAYAREGVAPSPELAGAFEQFKDWLTEVYKSVKRLLGRGKELSPEVRDIFDSLLLTEQKTGERRAESPARREAVPDDP